MRVKKVSRATAHFAATSRGIFINIACPRQLKILTWVDWVSATAPHLDPTEDINKNQLHLKHRKFGEIFHEH